LRCQEAKSIDESPCGFEKLIGDDLQTLSVEDNEALTVSLAVMEQQQ